MSFVNCQSLYDWQSKKEKKKYFIYESITNRYLTFLFKKYLLCVLQGCGGVWCRGIHKTDPSSHVERLLLFSTWYKSHRQAYIRVYGYLWPFVYLLLHASPLVTVDLPLYFPRDQPTLTFQSVYHFTNSGQLYSQVQKSYPYSPRWDGNEMAKRAK